MSNFTPEQIFASGSSNGGRIAPVRNEVLRLLQANLPAAVAYQNEREKNERGQSIAIPVPSGYYAARTSLDGIEKLPVILVSTSLDFEQPSPRVNFGMVTLGVFVIGERWEVRDQIDDLWDLAQIAALVMKQTQVGWALPDGRCAWRACVPSRIEALPGAWSEYSGIACYWQVNQQGLDLWTPAT